MKKIHLLLFFILVSVSSCHKGPKSDSAEEQVTQTPPKERSQVIDSSSIYKNEQMVIGTLYHQISGEYRALCIQAFRIARMMLDQDLQDRQVDKHRIVILDIDETVLDNSPYQAQCIKQNINYPQRWDEWCNKASANAVPGALEFTKYARANGVSLFYITNRKEHLKAATIKNLNSLGFPQADDEHVIMRKDENSKETRRKSLAEKYHIALLCGDNLNDFSLDFEKNTNSERIASVDNNYTEFGKRFIVLPNSMYGDWETILYSSSEIANDSLRKKARIKALKGF